MATSKSLLYTKPKKVDFSQVKIKPPSTGLTDSKGNPVAIPKIGDATPVNTNKALLSGGLSVKSAPFSIAKAGPGAGSVDFSNTNPKGSVLGASTGGGSKKGSSNYPSPTYPTPPSGPRTISPTALNTSGFGSTSITSASTAPSPSISLPSAPSYANPGKINNGGLINGQTDYELDPETGLFTVKEQDPETGRALDIQNLIQDLIPQKESASDDRDVRRQQQEVQKKRQIVGDYTSQLNSVVAQQNADLLNLRGVGSREGVTETVYGGQAATINREAAIKALPIQAALAGAQGNLELAQDYLTQLTSWKQEQIDNEYDYKIALYGSIKDFVTTSEKRRLDEMEKQEERAYNEKAANIKSQDEWTKMAIQNGQSNLVQSIAALNPASPTFARELSAIQSRVIDASNLRANEAHNLDLQLKRAQISKINFENQQAQNDLENGVLTDTQIKAIDTSPQGKKVTTLGDLRQKLGNYQNLVNTYGTASVGSQKSVLESAYNELKIAYKTAAELGAIQAPDIPVIEGALKNATYPNPFSQLYAKATGSGLGSIKAGLNQAMQTLNNSAGVNISQLYARNPAYRNSEYVSSLIDPLATVASSEATIDSAAVGQILRMPDGVLVQKQKDGSFKEL